MVYRHFGPKTLLTQDISALVPKCPFEVSNGHFGTNAKNLRHFDTGTQVSTRHFGTI